MLGETDANKIRHVSLSATTVTCRFADVAEYNQIQLLQRIKSPWHALQFDEEPRLKTKWYF